MLQRAISSSRATISIASVIDVAPLRWVVVSAMWRTLRRCGARDRLLERQAGVDASDRRRRPPSMPTSPASSGSSIGWARVPVTIVLDTPRRGLAVELQRQRQAPFNRRVVELAKRPAERASARSDGAAVRRNMVRLEPAARCQSPVARRQRGGRARAHRAAPGALTRPDPRSGSRAAARGERGGRGRRARDEAQSTAEAPAPPPGRCGRGCRAKLSARSP